MRKQDASAFKHRTILYDAANASAAFFAFPFV
jgi:hypothetical protein